MWSFPPCFKSIHKRECGITSLCLFLLAPLPFVNNLVCWVKWSLYCEAIFFREWRCTILVQPLLRDFSALSEKKSNFLWKIAPMFVRFFCLKHACTESSTQTQPFSKRKWSFVQKTCERLKLLFDKKKSSNEWTHLASLANHIFIDLSIKCHKRVTSEATIINSKLSFTNFRLPTGVGPLRIWNYDDNKLK